ncbi:MAG TPA: tetratricopeptide repeat protein [Planctomycetota bacterium]|nr:tetratricopeptide repeat protein [Planctomycetota bacterium]
MFRFIRNAIAYSEIKARLIRDAEFECQRMALPADQLLVEAFRKGNLSMTGQPMTDRGKANTRTPEQLKGVVEVLLSYPPVLSAWLVRYHIARALSTAHLPIHVQGDLMMALENANYVFPDKAEGAAALLAYALCMQPWLWLARATLFGLGTPLTERPVPQDQFQFIIKQGHLPMDVKPSGQRVTLLGWNCEMRANVANALERIDPRLSDLMKLQKFLRIRKRPLERWEHEPDRQAALLLEQGIELAGHGQFEKAIELLDRAGRSDPTLMPDVLRNKALILSKQKRYGEAAVLCREALNIEPEYADVWYLLGICLAQSRRFREALHAYERAKSLGFRSGGLEPNMATCRRAISNGLS